MSKEFADEKKGIGPKVYHNMFNLTYYNNRSIK